MSHPEQMGFLRLCRDHLCGGYSRPEIIEIGSYDVNQAGGGIRGLFASASGYVGVDLAHGPGVDHVASGHKVDFPADSFDIAISSECFEHNPYWAETFSNMHRMLRPGGLLIMTCATTGRVEHGTPRTAPKASPGTSAMGWSYYRNLTEADFRAAFDLDVMFSLHRFFTADTSHDLYFIGYKPGGAPSYDLASLEAGVRTLAEERRRAMPFVKRIARTAARSPLLVASRVLPERAFQNVAVPYSQLIYRIGGRFGVGF